MSTLEQQLSNDIRTIYTRPVNQKTQQFTQQFNELFGEHVTAVVAYGSKFSGKPSPTSIHDFFLFVDDYKSFYQHPFFDKWDASQLKMLNKEIPPNIFEYRHEDGELYHAKFNVLTIDHLEEYTSHKNNDIYLSGRFAKIMGICSTKDQATEDRIVNCVTDSYTKHLGHLLATLPYTFTADEFGRAHVGLGYKCNVRVEQPTKVDDLYHSGKNDYDQLFAHVLKMLDRDGKIAHNGTGGYIKLGSKRTHKKARRRAKNFFNKRKAHDVIRVGKNMLTTDNWQEYAINKAERATGYTINEKHPYASGSWVLAKHALHKLKDKAKGSNDKE